MLGIIAYFYWRYRKRIEEEKQLMPGYMNNYINSSDINRCPISDDPWEMDRDDVVVRYDAKLGAGAFADVYLGQILGDAAVKRVYNDVLCLKRFKDCDVAVKILPPFAAKTAKQDFQDEIDIMKILKYHLHLVCLLGYVNDSRPLLIIEYCKNGDLLQYVQERKLQISLGKEEDMKSRDLLSIAWQIANGLEYLASLDFVHRDIAARNVLLDKNNICKIGDFGLCRLADNSLYATQNERLPARWLSIECFKLAEYSTKTDVWSYGVLLFELFSLGDVPYESLENSQILEHLEAGNRLSKPKYATDDVYKVMVNCWEVEAEDRRSFAEICGRFLTVMESSNIFYNYVDANVQLEFLDHDESIHSAGQPEDDRRQSYVIQIDPVEDDDSILIDLPGMYEAEVFEANIRQTASEVPRTELQLEDIKHYIDSLPIEKVEAIKRYSESVISESRQSAVNQSEVKQEDTTNFSEI